MLESSPMVSSLYRAHEMCTVSIHVCGGMNV